MCHMELDIIHQNSVILQRTLLNWARIAQLVMRLSGCWTVRGSVGAKDFAVDSLGVPVQFSCTVSTAAICRG